MAKGLFLAYTNCAPDSDEQAFNHWYDTVHIPDLLELDGIVAARRVKLTGDAAPIQTASGPAVAQYLALYELATSDVAAVQQQLAAAAPRWREQGRIFAGIRSVNSAWYAAHGEPQTPVNPLAAPLLGVRLVYANSATARDDEFNHWYDTVHLPDVLSLEGYLAAQRFTLAGDGPVVASDQGGTATARYLAYYELATTDFDAVAARVRDARFGERGRMSDTLQVVARANYVALGDRRVAQQHPATVGQR